MLISDDVLEFDLEYSFSFPLEHNAVSDKTCHMSAGERTFLWVRCERIDDFFVGIVILWFDIHKIVNTLYMGDYVICTHLM